MDYEIDLVVAQAKDDGQRMERRLQELGEECNNMYEHTADYDALVAENRRLRISQLRRMADEAEAIRDDLIGYKIAVDAPIGSFLWRMARRKWWIAKFCAACLAEIARLRGEG